MVDPAAVQLMVGGGNGFFSDSFLCDWLAAAAAAVVCFSFFLSPCLISMCCAFWGDMSVCVCVVHAWCSGFWEVDSNARERGSQVLAPR